MGRGQGFLSHPLGNMLSLNLIHTLITCHNNDDDISSQTPQGTLPSTREHAMPKSITLSHVTTMMMIFTTSSRYHIANVTVTVVVNALTAIRTAVIARVMSHMLSKVSHP